MYNNRTLCSKMGMDHHAQKHQQQGTTNQPQQTRDRVMGEEMKAWLESRPELMRRLEEMKRICQNGRGEHNLLRQAESALVEQLDATGRELVGAWLEERNKQEGARASREPGLRKHEKKNFASRHSSARCRRTSK